MKLEIRIPKSETNPKLENTIDVAVKFRTSNFGFDSNFEFRVSDFLPPGLTLTHD
jgi:hypothetical protein